MNLLAGKKALIVGVANHRSIAWGIAQAMHAQGCALAFTTLEATEKWVRPLSESVGGAFVVPCDVSRDESLDALFAKVDEAWGTFDYLIHSVAFAPTEALTKGFLETRREDFRVALDVSAYSLVALVQRAAPRMNEGGSIITLTYHGSRQIIPHYNVMGVAKAALECAVRYLAPELGERNIRINAISSGPIRTLAASAIGGFKKMLDGTRKAAPLKRTVTQEELGSTAVFLCSPMSSAITGECLYVDCGLSLVGASSKEEQG